MVTNPKQQTNQSLYLWKQAREEERGVEEKGGEVKGGEGMGN